MFASRPHRVLLAIAGFVAVAVGLRAASSQSTADRKDWIQLFNGKNMDGWVPKITGYDLGDNYADTFRVENGVLKVAYDKYTQFDGKFGHLFYKQQKFSYYLLAAEYRFVGTQVPGGPGWANRNNGLMLHSQAPETMGKNQDFPISIEVQLLGGLDDGKPRTTANVCTPGTEIFMKGAMVRGHCTNSSSKTYPLNEWVRIEVEVRGGEHFKHMIDGQTVLEYSKPQIGGGQASPTDPAVKVDGTPLTGGFIALQAETAPTDFRKVELLNLEGCTDPKARNYKTYFVKANAAMCRF